jgi:hypothetical protein
MKKREAVPPPVCISYSRLLYRVTTIFFVSKTPGACNR